MLGEYKVKTDRLKPLHAEARELARGFDTFEIRCVLCVVGWVGSLTYLLPYLYRYRIPALHAHTRTHIPNQINRHIERAENARADQLANQALDAHQAPK